MQHAFRLLKGFEKTLENLSKITNHWINIIESACKLRVKKLMAETAKHHLVVEACIGEGRLETA
jgi:hypothetical protein